eukprot:7358246-Alexandrium_andersonii.AAC.1
MVATRPHSTRRGPELRVPRERRGNRLRAGPGGAGRRGKWARAARSTQIATGEPSRSTRGVGA